VNAPTRSVMAGAPPPVFTQSHARNKKEGFKGNLGSPPIEGQHPPPNEYHHHPYI